MDDPLPITYDTSGGLLSTAFSFTQTVTKFLASAFQVSLRLSHQLRMMNLQLIEFVFHRAPLQPCRLHSRQVQVRLGVVAGAQMGGCSR